MKFWNSTTNAQLLLIFVFMVQICSARYVPINSTGTFSPYNLFAPESLKNDPENIPMAYYDFNHDRKIDILTQSVIYNSKNQPLNYLNLFIWQEKKEQFHLVDQLLLTLRDISGILPGDYTADGITDLAVIYNSADQMNLPIKSLSFLKIQCKTQSICMFSKNDAFDLLKIDANLEPFVLMVQGKEGIAYKQLGQLKILSRNSAGKIESSLFEAKLPNNPESLKNSLAQANHFYYGDYDGDCISDFITMHRDQQGTTFNFYQGAKGDDSITYQFVKTIFRKPGNGFIHHFSLADANFDGKMDLMLLFQSNNTIYLQTHYHIQGYKTTLCTKPNSFSYDFQQLSSTAPHRKIQRIKLVEHNALLTEQSILRFGDYNIDGYTDLTLTYVQKDINWTHSELFNNLQCQGANCGSYNQNFVNLYSTINIRTFIKKNIFISQLYTPSITVNQIFSLTFFDLYEDGYMDLIACFQDPGTKKKKIATIINGQRVDAFFLKIMLLDGSRKSPKQNGLYIGGTVSFFVTRLNGQAAPAIGNQLSQLTGKNLLLPYVHIGLGRTNNYVESVTATLPSSFAYQQSWTSIVPNSQIIITPKSEVVSKWTLQSYITPTQKLVGVFWIVVFALIIISCGIIYLTRKQKQEDRENQNTFFSTLR